MPTMVLLSGFAFGEDRDPLTGRSLGYRLLTPAGAPWQAEVEGLARLLQAGAYPEHWPPAELFCSVLLADGHRLVAVARYGRGDHTAGQRRGGLELVGVVGPAELAPADALQVYRWLRHQLADTDDLRRLGLEHTLEDIRAEAPPAEPAPVPWLPIEVWRDGVLLVAAASAGAPDQALGLLSLAAGANWQWLPLCGSDFPLEPYARRGPLVAWTVQRLDVAVRLTGIRDRGSGLRSQETRGKRPGKWYRPAPVLAGVLLLLLTANLWALWSLPGRLQKAELPGNSRSAETNSHAAGEPARDPLAPALHRLLQQQKVSELEQAETSLLARYNRLVMRDEALRVEGKQAQTALAFVSVLAGRSADRVAQLIEEEFRGKQGYDQDFIHLLAQRVRQRLAAEVSHP